MKVFFYSKHSGFRDAVPRSFFGPACPRQPVKAPRIAVTAMVPANGVISGIRGHFKRPPPLTIFAKVCIMPS